MINNKETDLETIENTLLHFPEDISKEINKYAIDDVLKESRYMFTTRKGRKQYGYCTHCKSEYLTYKLKHKSKTICENCNSICKVQVAGYSRKKMIDEAYFVYYEKSKINKEAVIARGFEVRMDFSGDYKNVKPQYRIAARYLFEMGNPVFLKTNLFWWSDMSEMIGLRKSVFTLYKQIGAFGGPIYRNQKVSIESIREAVKDTQFQYSEWDNYKQCNFEDYVEFFDLYTRYPQIEYLKKLGFDEFVLRKLYKGSPTYRAINWRGKTLDKVLKIDKHDIKEAVELSNSIDHFVLKIYQLAKEDGSNFTFQEAIEIKNQGLEWEYDELLKVIDKIRFRKLINYLKKQTKMNEAENEETDPHQAISEYRNLRQTFITLNDYWSGCRQLDLKIGNDIVEYPTNLQTAHDNIYEQIEYKENAELDKKIEDRLKDLSKLEYENESFIIRPFESSKEIAKESKALKHCVGMYTKKYANGNTILLSIRKKDAPEEPFYTMQVQDGKVRQYYGYENNQKIKKSKEIIEFVEDFKRDVLNVKNNEKGIAS